MRKNKIFNVDTAKFKAMELKDNPEFYSRDTDAYLTFTVPDESFEFDKALLYLINIDDGSVVTEIETQILGQANVEYEIPSELMAHYGRWRGQIVFEKDGEKASSAIFDFIIKRFLTDERPPTLNEVESISKLRRDAKELIAELSDTYDDLLENGVLQTNINNKLTELETQYSPKLTEVSAQLAQTDRFAKTRDSYGSPIYPTSRLKLLATLDNNLKNYVGKNIVLSNDSSEELPTKLLATFNENVTNFKDRAEPVNNSALAYANMAVGKGVKFDGTQGLTYTLRQVNHMNSGGISFKFKPLKGLKTTDNIEYNFLYGYNGDKLAFYANLNYLESGGIKGLNIRIMNGSNIFIASVQNIDFNADQEYHVAFSWEWDGKSAYANAQLFLDGVYQRSWTFNPNCLPTGLNKVIVGNAPAFNRPAQSIMSDVIIINDDFSPTNIQELSSLPLDPASANIPGAYGNVEAGKFYKGHLVDGKKRLIAPLARSVGNVLEGSASVRIKPLGDIKQGINQVKKLFTLASDLLGDIIDVNLNYDTSANIFGLEVKMSNGSLTTLTTARNLEFLENVSYTVGVEWKITPGQSEGYLCVYVDGRLVKVAPISEQNKPSNIYEMRVGNNNALNQPIDSVVEAIVYGERVVGTYGQMKLHHSPLDLSAVSRGDAYTREFEAVGYSGEKVSHIILNEIEGRLFGVQDIRFGVMKVSDDEGQTWKDYYNFGSEFGLTNPRIDFIEKFNGYEFVGIRDANGNIAQLVRSNNSGGYESILSFTSGRYMVNDWNWTTYQNSIVVTEYGQNPSLPSKAYRSTDNGNTWQVIFTAPAGTNHIHSAKFDPYTGWLYLAYGDNITELLRSKDRGATWETLDNDLTNKVISFTFKRDAIYMSCDYYGGVSLLRVWDKTKDEMFRLSPQTKTHNVHTYAVYFDKAGYMWWYSFADGGSTMTDRHSSFYISGDHGISEVRLEDRGREIISYPYRFIETDNFMWFGNYKMTKPALRRLM